LIGKWWKDAKHFDYVDEEEIKMAIENAQQKSISLLFDFCQKKLPPRFFDILYQNEEIFTEDSEMNTKFLPHLHFTPFLI